jgi:predicted transposase YbfD/YdcC
LLWPFYLLFFNFKDGTVQCERRTRCAVCITTARLFAVRAHWLIENALHWTLDVIFDEDNLRVRKKNAGQNMAIIRHVVFKMIQP